MAVQSETLIVEARLERWPYASPFRISGYEWSEAELVYVEIERGGLRGRGECAGVYYHENDSPADCLAQIENMRETLASGAGRLDLLQIMPAGGARNAIDCALWDLEAKEQQRPVWQLAGLEKPQPVRTTYTIGADDPAVMAKGAIAFSDATALKLKLTGTGEDEARVRAVRDARPDVWLAVDANQGFTRAFLEQIMPALVEAQVSLIEQPVAIGREADLEGLHSPIPLAADESAQTLEDLPPLVDRFHIVNIKLDKCGGLTAGLAMARRARQLGLGVMVGNMMGTSIAMAPAFLIGQLCDVTDLDGPLLLRSDRKPSVEYRHGNLSCGEDVWGGAK
ncbi:MAG TPA: dipeptide epimerase [Candidatus Baltobacteraceae bacterium]|nr:dipeptide epimerase [Candidatus Baltobacteraceae bacterium]